MRKLATLFTTLLAVLNLLCVILLLCAAYSSYVDGEIHPARASMGLVFPVFAVANLCFLVLWLLLRKWYLSLLPILGFLVCFPPLRLYCPLNARTAEADLPEQRIKLLTYNVMNFNTMEKVDGQNPMLSYILRQNPDIVCMQEFVPTINRKYLTQEDIDELLESYPYKHIQPPGLACYSKFPILSALPIDYGSRTNGSVMYELLIGTDTVTLINNHLESNKLSMSDRETFETTLQVQQKPEEIGNAFFHLLGKLNEAVQKRSYQAKVVEEVVREAQAKGRHVIVCGDFNDSPLSNAHRILTQNLNDAFSESGRGLGSSFNQNKFYFRIDNILVSHDLRTYNCTVDNSISSSDHYPMWCYITKKK
ncbi:MAG: endonuclease/exonuclease/phosphatase family protein [Prevotellaceae bacterium]|jgi:endonuclease/exonuclease/phosphatase family metal-dependent hydrolase|nr:endonuclease/exonuclease/phosphatase family protein [Prevotellaceae bacterium]